VATGIAAFTYGNQRFVLAAVPALCLAAAMTLVDLWHRRRPPGTAAGERSSAKSLVAASSGDREPPRTTPDL
jgi:hypothetical protein